jgi:hypothetical protein
MEMGGRLDDDDEGDDLLWNSVTSTTTTTTSNITPIKMATTATSLRWLEVTNDSEVLLSGRLILLGWRFGCSNATNDELVSTERHEHKLGSVLVAFSSVLLEGIELVTLKDNFHSMKFGLHAALGARPKIRHSFCLHFRNEDSV